MDAIFHQPKNTLPRIEEIYAFVSVDEEDGNEGVIGAPVGPVGCMPLVAADRKRVESYMPIAQQIANLTGKPIRLIRLTKREEVGFITPQKEKGK